MVLDLQAGRIASRVPKVGPTFSNGVRRDRATAFTNDASVRPTGIFYDGHRSADAGPVRPSLTSEAARGRLNRIPGSAPAATPLQRRVSMGPARSSLSTEAEHGLASAGAPNPRRSLLSLEGGAHGGLHALRLKFQ